MNTFQKKKHKKSVTIFKKYSISLITRETQIIATVRYYFI